MKKKVLLTGGTGFLGAYLMRYLLQHNVEIYATRRASSPMDLVADIADQVHWLEGDILDYYFLEKACAQVDEVYHAAAIVSYDSRDHEKMYAVNATGTARLVDAALATHIKKFLMVSSIAALGRKPFKKIIDEQADWENNKMNTQYAISKFRAESEVWRGVEEGLSAVIINPSVIIGAGFWTRGTAAFFHRVDKGLAFFPTGETGFVDVRDVAHCAIALMESDIQNQRFILNAENWSYQQLFQTIAQHLNKKAPQIAAKPWITNLAWRLEWFRSRLLGKRPMLTRETARNASSTYHYVNDKITTTLGYSFRPLADTLKDTAQAYQTAQIEGKSYALLPI